jgi:hypothetical protein
MSALREFRSFSRRAPCAMAQDANYPFAYSKYEGQILESKGRTNSNFQDFRHECSVYGGLSKCHICEQIECQSDAPGHFCDLQLQGVNSSYMSKNIPTVSDTSWAVGGQFRHDYGGNSISHLCVMLSGDSCTNPYSHDFSACRVRCFGHHPNFTHPPVKKDVMQRSLVDVYPGMFRWIDDGQVDLYNYPSNCEELKKYQGVDCSFSSGFPSTSAVRKSRNPSFNPQGYVFTVAGATGGRAGNASAAGFVDGAATSARFKYPQYQAHAADGTIFVADTKNHAIRMISVDGTVSTLAGKGPYFPGSRDGPCDAATFSSPRGIDVLPSPYNTTHGINSIIIVVADTGNHRIRKVEFNPHPITGFCYVSCLSGLCGNDTLSFTATSLKAQDVLFVNHYPDRPSSELYVVVADTGNFILRLVSLFDGNGTTLTLAGNIIPGERATDGTPLAGCSPPCLQGNPGYRDGNLTFAQFYQPLALSRGLNNTIWVVDEQRIRVVELPSVITTMYGIHSKARVSTIAGNSLPQGMPGHDDGLSQLSTFYYTSGVTVTSRGVAYVTDSASCHIRRIVPFPIVAEKAACSSLISDFIRPSGCVSYDMPLDQVGRKISRVEGNIQYNYEPPLHVESSFPSSPTPGDFIYDKHRGKYIKNCVGVSPYDRFDKHFIFDQGDNLVIDDHRVALDEDSEKGMAILLQCPSLCNAQVNLLPPLAGSGWYSEYSSVCLAAIHDGKISAAKGGIIQVIIERYDYFHQYGLDRSALKGSSKHGLSSVNITSPVPRVFRIESYNDSNNMVSTIAGFPNAPLQDVCGYADAQPPMAAKFNYPGGIATRPGIGQITDREYLYIADTNNHVIRALSAVCSFICENGGRCVGDDKCQCLSGWSGIDCTKPVCTSSCPLNTLCVGPNKCDCKPGFKGFPSCIDATCQQPCLNGAKCVAPDTCACRPGWFDSNCSTPICSNTCGNGGNCTAPNTCTCPQEWMGPDCRIPVCKQQCQNQGTASFRRLHFYLSLFPFYRLLCCPKHLSVFSTMDKLRLFCSCLSTRIF